MDVGKLQETFGRNFRERGEIGASVSVWKNGVEIAQISDGWSEKEQLRKWDASTLVPVYSATKVPAAAALLLVLASRGLDENTLVAEIWPRFPVPVATFGDMLSHQCGLPVLDEKADVFDHPAVVAALEAQEPAWQPGEGHGYHPRTFGALAQECVQRLAGKPLGEIWREEIAGPLGLDFWIGLPECEWPRVARLYPGKASKNDLADGFYKELSTPESFTRRAFSSPKGLQAVQEMNDPRAWTAGFPAMGGIGTACALAEFYQVLLGQLPGPFGEGILKALATPQSDAFDRVLLRRTVFTCGAQRDPLAPDQSKEREIYGPGTAAFGHPGAGGSHAFADPSTGISFAYTMNQMELSVMPAAKCLELVRATFA